MPKFIVNLTIQGIVETTEDMEPLDILSPRKYNEDFAKELKLHRHAKGLTLHQLSKLSGVSPSHIGRIERGERSPNYLIAIKLRKALGGETNG